MEDLQGVFMEDLESWLERVYQAGGERKTLDTLYDEWSKDYDQQLWASGNPYIAIATGLVGRHVHDYDAKILDAGCGTGNMAQVLHQMGYRNIEGLDPSAGMLAVAPPACLPWRKEKRFTSSCIGFISTLGLSWPTKASMRSSPPGYLPTDMRRPSRSMAY